MVAIERGATKRLLNDQPSLDPVDMILLAQKVDSVELYVHALDELVKRKDVLTMDEAERIGLDAFHNVTARKAQLARVASAAKSRQSGRTSKRTSSAHVQESLAMMHRVSTYTETR